MGTKKNSRLLQIVLAFIATLLLLQPVSVFAIPQDPNQGGPNANSWTLAERAKQWALAQAFARCISKSDPGGALDKVTTSELQAGNWFAGFGSNTIYTAPSFLSSGSHNESDYSPRGVGNPNGVMDCNNIAKEVSSSFIGDGKFSDMEDMFCTVYNEPKRADDSACRKSNGGQGDYQATSVSANTVLSRISEKVWGTTISLDDAGRYIIYRAAFNEFCKPTQTDTPAPEYKYVVKEYDTTANKIIDTTYAGSRKNTDLTGTYVYATYAKTMGTSDPPGAKESCKSMVESLNKYAGAYGLWAVTHPQEAQDTLNNGGKNTGGGSESSCTLEGVGWIVCAVANFMATITDGMYEHVIANMLSVPPLNVDTADGENGTYNAWSSIRNIANVLFVIAFLIVVYSQITGLGISNYAIKKMLPRIVLSAILVNLSYWIAAVGVDVSNILGAGIYDMLQGIRGGLNIGNVNGWAAVTTMLLSGGAIAGGVVLGGAITVVAVGAMTPAIAMALIGILLPLLLGALLAIFIVIFILVARQALVVILIIASPLAFVAFLLPNTQQWFTKWRQWFVSLLLLYPIVSFMVGGAQIAGLVLISTASNGFTDVIGDTIKIMSGLFVMVVPFFFLPFMIRRYGGAGLDRLAGSIKAKGGKLIAPVGKVGRKMGMQAMGRQWESLKAGNAPAMRRSRFGGRLGRGIDRLRTGAAQGATRGAQGYSQWQARNKMESEHYADQQQEALLDRLSTDEAFRTAAAGGDAAAADRLAARADAQVHKRRIDDATARLRTLSRDERIALAHGRTVTTAAGHTIVPDVAMQEAAIKSVAPSMDSREALDLADALGGGHGVDAAVRRAGVESLAGKAPQLTGSQLGALEGDTYSRDAATLAGLTGGKFDADWMATKAKADDIDELVAHIAGTTDPAERARLQAIVDDAVGKLDSTDTLRARVVAGSDLDQALDRLASSRSIPTSGPSGGTPPPSGSSGTGTPP